jgi:16S rRNA (uracil1498-N3)-methyltransferase
VARRRFFVSEIRRGIAELTGADADHLVRVLRVEAGQIFEVSDNRHVYLAQVDSARKSAVSFRILEQLPEPTPSVHIHVLAALIKFERFEWLVEKATELGGAVIQPVDSIRTERGLAQASQKRSARWERIAREASEQSRRAHIPEIAPAISFRAALNTTADVRLLLDEAPEANPVLQALPVVRTPEDQVALLFGPEGGWTDEERRMAIEAGWIACSLGGTVLRAETAALSAIAIVQAAWQTTRRAEPPQHQPVASQPAAE